MSKNGAPHNCIGSRIQQARKKNGISQVELAAILSVDHNIPMDRVQISRIERCIRSVRDKEVIAFAKALDISPNWLFSWREDC